jgi:hypothetical protein
MMAGRIDALSGGWALFWNELLDGAPQGPHRSVAATANWIGEVVTARTATARWFDATFADGAAASTGRDDDPRPTGSPAVEPSAMD